MSIKIIVADDHCMIREGIKKILEIDNNIEIVSEASDGIEALGQVEKSEPDILLLDINMPEMDGLEVLKNIKKQEMSVRVLIITMHNEIEYFIKARELGCDGYLLKSCSGEMLKKAIYEVYNGNKFVQDVANIILREKQGEKNISNEKIKELTKREIEGLKHIAESHFNKEIAAKLNISERTVKNHVSNIFKKIDVSDRTQAAVFAIKNNIVSL